MPCFTNLISSDGGASAGGSSYCQGITCENVFIRKTIPSANIGVDNTVFYISSTTDGTNIYIFRYGYGLYKFNGSTITQMTLPVSNVTALTGCTIIWYNGALHMIGGIERSSGSTDPTCINDHYKYTSTGWVKVATLPVPMFHGSAVVYDNRLLIIENLHEADDNRSGDGDYTTSHKFAVYQYTSSSNSWSQFGPDIISGRTEQRVIPSLYTDGKSLFVGRSYKLYIDSVEDERYRYTDNGWIYWGSDEVFPGNGVNNNNKFVELLGRAIYVGANTLVLNNSLSWQNYNENCTYRIKNPLAVMNGELYGIQDVTRIIEKYTPATAFNLPAGTIIYSNDTEIAGINGSKTLSTDDTITISHKPGIYATIVVGKNLIYMQADVKAHRVYGLKGMTVNNTKLVTNGLVTIPNISYNLSVTY